MTSSSLMHGYDVLVSARTYVVWSDALRRVSHRNDVQYKLARCAVTISRTIGERLLSSNIIQSQGQARRGRRRLKCWIDDLITFIEVAFENDMKHFQKILSISTDAA